MNFRHKSLLRRDNPAYPCGIAPQFQHDERCIKHLFYQGENEVCRIRSSHFAALHLDWGLLKATKDHHLKGDDHMFEVLKSRYSTWKRYSRTLQELEALSTRELADLGISRSDIPRLAREAARQ